MVAAYGYLHMMEQAHARLKDILTLSIYLELGTMIGIYFKAQQLSVHFLTYILIIARVRQVVVDPEWYAGPRSTLTDAGNLRVNSPAYTPDYCYGLANIRRVCAREEGG